MAPTSPLPADPTPFRLTLEVRPDDIDELDHVNNSVYLRWVQAVAVAHWRALALPAMQSETVWVVLRHEIDYKSPALAGDTIIAETWVGAATRITFERFTKILRAADGHLLASARTLWCPLDAQTRKPKRVDAAVRAIFSDGKE